MRMPSTWVIVFVIAIFAPGCLAGVALAGAVDHNQQEKEINELRNMSIEDQYTWCSTSGGPHERFFLDLVNEVKHLGDVVDYFRLTSDEDSLQTAIQMHRAKIQKYADLATGIECHVDAIQLYGLQATFYSNPCIDAYYTEAVQKISASAELLRAQEAQRKAEDAKLMDGNPSETVKEWRDNRPEAEKRPDLAASLRSTCGQEIAKSL